ncbi:CPXCG motif-containing cysteine-rich protein [Echinicola rosea]|uniref:CPXCG motif-containing cysteine-rich protein n=1 Tax=Echinicola rosea TaxID=1807691 RepID=UPI001E4496B2|nr:CPXCG motif-containing cysteine-rich protein [Echinicola rosea]
MQFNTLAITMLTIEHHFTCPHCLASISMILDLSVSPQQYIEDCEVCCQPIEVHFETEGENLTNFSASPVEQ